MALQDFIEIKAGTKIRGCLINTERNKALLEEIPHRDFLDLSLVYTMELPALKTAGGILWQTTASLPAGA